MARRGGDSYWAQPCLGVPYDIRGHLIIHSGMSQGVSWVSLGIWYSSVAEKEATRDIDRHAATPRLAGWQERATGLVERSDST